MNPPTLQALLVLSILAPSSWSFAEPPPDAPGKRRAELERLLRILPKSPVWEKWLQQSGELPPDFEKLPRVAGLPDPLKTVVNGQPNRITDVKGWQRRRVELRNLFEKHVWGTIPPPPGNVRATVLAEHKEARATVQQVRLEFGPDHAAKLTLELIVPTGQGPFPVFLAQKEHRAWALLGVSRGYIGCVYNGSDAQDDTGSFVPVWPKHDWGKLTRRAWAASRCIDYLGTLAFVDRQRIAMAGHSRNGKVALMAAALDPRIGAVVSSSSGQCGACSYRLFAEPEMAESIEVLTRENPDWLHPRLRFYVGREDRLPVDQNEVLALIAPRACLIGTARNDNTESTWSVQQTYLSARSVYDLLGAGDRLRIQWRPGAHETRASDIQVYFDWFDRTFGRGNYAFPEVLLHPRYEDWRKSGEKIEAANFAKKAMDDLPVADRKSWEAQRQAIRARIRWGLGEEPAGASSPGGTSGEPSYRATLLKRFLSPPAEIGRQSINWGEYVVGDIYYPKHAVQPGRKIPLVIWLNPHSCARGYVPSSLSRGMPHLALAREGLAVLAFDAIGTGYRIEEETQFYRRYPRWSLLAKMVRDVQGALEAVRRVPFVDPERVYVAGYGLGGRVALHVAALDERVAGAVCVAGFTPMRLETADKGTGGVARVTQWYPLQPRLGAFLGQEERIPYDFHEVLALIAPRLVLVVSPRLDRTATLADIETCVRQARRAFALYGDAQRLRHEIPEDYNQYGLLEQKLTASFLKEIGGVKGK